MNKLTTFDLRVPLTSAAHTIALQFAAEQDNPIKGKQVYLNTLAVIAVQKCLSWVGVESNFAISDCFNPSKRAIFDVADLSLLPGGERPIIECRPVLPNQTQVTIPPESIEDRLGCVAVEFYPHMNNVKMRGFKEFKEFEEIEEKKIAIESFDRFARIFDCLPDINYILPETGLYGDDSWKLPEEFGLKQPIYANNHTSENEINWKIKEFYFNNTSINEKIVLMIGCPSKIHENSSIKIVLRPSSKDRDLPRNLSMIIESKSGILQSIDSKLQSKLTSAINISTAGAFFSIKLKYENQVFGENFVVNKTLH
jgi:hypothetical protein